MKHYLILALLLVAGTICHAQKLKKAADWLKRDVEWRAQRKAGQKIEQGLDSVFAAPKKIKDKKAAKENTTVEEKQETKKNSDAKSISSKPSNNNINAKPKKEAVLETVDGHVTLKLSADKIFTGGSILISGESVRYKNLNQVGIVVTGPSPMDVRKITLDSKGKYFAEWAASEITGDYTVTVTSSDGKAKESASFTVEELETEYAEDWPEANRKETKKALDNLEEASDRVEGEISSKNKAELDKKMKELKSQVEDVFKLFT
ncbi:MAG: hypothetical protein ACXWV9_08460, partial [Flavisolibacter sp.]